MNARAAAWSVAAGAFFIPLAASLLFVDVYASAKWLVVYLSTIFALSILYLGGHRFVFPAGKVGASLLLSFVCYLCSFILNGPGPFEGHFLDALCFMSLVLISYNLARTRSSFFEALTNAGLLATYLVSAHVLLQSLNIEPLPKLPHSEIPSGTFGFQNMSAEFLGIGILLMLGRMRSAASMSVATLILFSIGTLCGMVSLFIANSRAATVGIVLAIASYVLLGSNPRKLNQSRRFIGYASGLIVFSFLAAIAVSGLDPAKQSKKSWNTQIRVIRWLNTLELIKDNALTGIGPGQFEFGYLPYSRAVQKDSEANENQVVRSPHNGYLELFAECGLPIGAGILICLAYILKLLVRRSQESQEARCVLAIVVFLLFDAFVAFPMENPYPFFIAALVLGLTCSYVCSTNQSLSEKWGAIGIPALLCFLIYLSGWSLQSSLAQTILIGNRTAVEAACNNFSSQWRNCIEDAYNSLQAGHPEQALEKIKSVLERQPSNFVAMKLKSEIELGLNLKSEACQTLATYDQWFDGRSSLHSTLISLCSR